MGKKTVLIVEDEPRLLDSTSRILKEWFNVVQASCGSEMKERLKACPIDCVVLDIGLPDMNGVECLRSLRQSDNDVPVIIVTGRSTHVYAEQCADLGVSGYVNKPYDIEELAKRIGKAASTYVPRRLAPESGDLHAKLREAAAFVNENYCLGITAEDVSRKVGISPDYLCRLFKQGLGCTLISYIAKVRVEMARRLVEETDLTMAEIMEKTGFSTEQHFYKQFKKHTGTTPATFRKQS